ncbi:NAD(P)/FAD-dependent oxidoreductase [Burkholderia thailandensis]|uniref:3-hydroxyacyl-CoA dehydrogenase, NAD binding domain protein n=2 Tax=Burkholderia thailandensis TaxID=57975 RepID=A0AAW9CXS1_BURTH|nr:FAD-dependent oxidoreductase [Burkholderia thailandensis]AHI67133.1 3-hydroxyacyl-CoA dehydrogenase, NAD binding domain protein [Burkholderia thailandensis H0587]AIP64909.1 D-amino acid oxidase [Burkholderia thailandensis]AJY32747.1 3-hydroxyacyl-CoA dehydrogenase, NAD binding domain protein [Burkholderia thailandensis 34]AOI55578.1 D-amino-acid oxidase [Burkholderia thailandensis]AOJ54538.1 D-amino-acid oxidase [Burkholderia thailandensis]
MIDSKIDVVVIGAGIVGAACAHEFAQRGLRVTVVDDGRGGATAAGMGHLVAMDDNAAELALTHYSIGLWRALRDAMPEGCAYRNCGTLWLAADAHEMDLARAKQAALAEHGVAGELIDRAALAALEPMLRADLGGALKVSGDGILYAPVAAHWLLHRLPGVALRRAKAVAIDGARVALENGDVLRADAVVVANGVAARELVPELPLRPKKGHLLITDRYPAQVSHQLVELGYAASAHASDGTSVAFNVQPRPTGQLLIGSSRQFDTEDPRVEAPVLARMLRRALGYLPALAGMNGIRAWTGFRAASPDGLPLLGEHPSRRGLWLAVGHEGLGVTTAPGGARVLAALMFGERAAIDAGPYLPGRFLSTSKSAAAGELQ